MAEPSCMSPYMNRSVNVARKLLDRHERVLLELWEQPTRAVTLAKRLGLTHSGVTSTLYALQARGLAERVPRKGWIRR